MTRGPDASRRPDQRPDCTESMAAPKRDGIGAVLGLVSLFVGVALLKEGDDDDEALGSTFLLGGVVVMAASYASGGIGYFRVKKCRAAIREYEQRHPMGPYPPQPYPPQPYPPQPYPPPAPPPPAPPPS